MPDTFSCNQTASPTREIFAQGNVTSFKSSNFAIRVSSRFFPTSWQTTAAFFLPASRKLIDSSALAASSLAYLFIKASWNVTACTRNFSGRTKEPFPSAHVKYRTPWWHPSCFPLPSVSHSTPTQPSCGEAPSTRPTNRTVPRKLSTLCTRSPTESSIFKMILKKTSGAESLSARCYGHRADH